jgi:hypothetical protein
MGKGEGFVGEEAGFAYRQRIMAEDSKPSDLTFSLNWHLNLNHYLLRPLKSLF